MADEAYPFPGTSQITTFAQWEAFFNAIQSDGVQTGLDPSLNSGARTAGMGAGSAYLRGFFKPVSSTTSTAVPAAAGQDRIDRLVLRMDRAAAAAADFVKPVVLTGTPGASPVPPALTQSLSPTGKYDLPISRWRSTAAGALTDLKDERYFVGGGFATEARTQGLLPVWPPRLGVERGSNRVYRSDGAAWTLFGDDSGEVACPIGFTTAWETPPAPVNVNYVRRVNGACHLMINLRRKGDTWSTADPDGTHLLTVPDGFRPAANRPHSTVGHFSGGIVARIEVRADGKVYALNPSVNVPVGRILRHSMTYLPA